MAMMNYLSKGINVPSEHIENGTVLGYEIPTAETGGRKIIPFRMHASKNRPEKSFAAVRYQDYWYYVDNRDIDSKITLGLVIALFRILAPSGGGAAPILTLPTG